MERVYVNGHILYLFVLFFCVPFHQIDSQKECAWDEEVHINELVSSCRNTGPFNQLVMFLSFYMLRS